MSFKIATWNVNSLRVRLPQVLDWLANTKPDVLALQETKVPDADFPLAEIRDAGYEVVFSGQKAYNGVAVLSRQPAAEVVTDIAGLDDPQRRILAVTMGNVRILNLYVPNGESVSSEKYRYKLNWLENITTFLAAELKTHANLVVLGDFNIAPEDRDVHDPALWQGQVLCSEPERAAFQGLLQLGLTDCFRLHSEQDGCFSWWDYRLNGFKRNRGLRIDHVLASNALAAKCTQCDIDKTPRAWERPSDHAPVIAQFAT